MKKIFLLVFLAGSIIAHGQQIIQKDPAIEKMVSEVNSDSLHRYINTLVSFHTRPTPSAQLPVAIPASARPGNGS